MANWKQSSLVSLIAVLLLAGTIPAVRWPLDQEHFFIADDWGWLYRAALPPIFEYARPWPLMVYSDRPAGALLVTAVYRVFGLDVAVG